jgi:GNAT superfamily N-acetyltransferase
VAVDKGKIVGVRPFLLSEMWLENRRLVTAQHCDTLVHPEYRNQGIFNRMGEFASRYLRDHDCALSWGFPGPMSRRGFLSQGYRILAPLELTFRLLKPGSLIGRYVPPKALSVPVGNIIDRIYRPAGISLAGQAGLYQIIISDSFIPDLANLDALRDAKAIGMVRSETNLRWRFDTHPQYRYRYIAAKKNGELCGYAVTQVFKEYCGLKAGLIMDYLVRDGDLDCFSVLIAQAMEGFKAAGCYAMSIWAFSEPRFQHELIHKLGFKSSKKFPYRRVIRTGYMDVLAINEQDVDGVDIYDSTKWRVTYAFPNFF